jgi:hypothetical protein
VDGQPAICKLQGTRYKAQVRYKAQGTSNVKGTDIREEKKEFEVISRKENFY